MDSRDDLRQFLTLRRERLTPELAGLPNFGGRRRVKGCVGRRSRCSRR
jgi:hypothetical protein